MVGSPSRYGRAVRSSSARYGCSLFTEHIA